MKKPEEYKDRLNGLHTRHYLALEQAEFIYPLYQGDKSNKKYEEDNDKIDLEFGEINRLLENLQHDVTSANNSLRKKNKKLKNILDKVKKDEKNFKSKNTGYDDTERALIEMKNDYKKRQSETFIKAVDMTLGIILVCYLIYKKSK